jgi:chemotaxis protein methyltransferase CheR
VAMDEPKGKADYLSLKLTPLQFDKISRLVYAVAGIHLHEGKEELVKARLIKRLRHLQLTGFDEYLRYLKHDKTGNEIQYMVDMLTTNKTDFFREPEHLLFLKEKIVPWVREKRVRIWSAGCSSGEEPYSIAMVLCESLPDIDAYDVKILATDISERMIEKARQAEYGEEALQDVPSYFKQKYFESWKTGSGRTYKVKSRIRQLVKFARLNLMDDWPMLGPFDVIFCRNVMIYFDKPTQENLINRFCRFLTDGGYLLVGHSESLNFLSHDLVYVKPAVYRKMNPSHAVREKAGQGAGKDKL